MKFLLRALLVTTFFPKALAWKKGEIVLLPQNTAFFQLTLFEDVNLLSQILDLSVWQCGNHLKNYRNLSNKFKPSDLTLMLFYNSSLLKQEEFTKC